MNKYEKLVFASLLLFSALFIAHTIFIQTQKFYIYEILRDILISIMTFTLAFYTLRLAKKEDINFEKYLLISGLLLMIFTIHFLRLFFGGGLC